MLKLRSAPLAVFGLCAALAFAQDTPPGADPAAPQVEATPAAENRTNETAAPAETPAPATPVRVRRRPRPAKIATPLPAPTPAPKQGFWSRIFGKKKAAATPAPTTPKPRGKAPAVTTPKPKSGAGKAKATPVPEKVPATPKPKPKKIESAEAKPEAKKPVGEKPDAAPSDGPVKVDEPRATPAPKKGSKTAKTTALAKVEAAKIPDSGEAEAAEEAKYNEAKAKAVSDSKVQDLRAKADNAPTEEESRKALRAYNRALFGRMREIDPSIKDHVDRMEAAVLRRLGE